MTHAPFRVLLEDNHLLAVVKPAELPTMGVAEDRPSLLTEAKRYIKQKYQKPGNVYLGVVSRLDAPVTGVVVLARTSKAARRLTEQFRARTVRKRYWCLVQPSPKPEQGRWVDWLRKDERHRRMHIAEPESPGAQQASLSYRVLRTVSRAVLVEIDLETGRKHQIRVQLSSHGHPILGDRKYGSRVAFPRGIALHARQLEFDHPVRNERLTLTAPTPKSWQPFL
jgi:23S rRNA pseudouridine1911/1915/1917 synthase